MLSLWLSVSLSCLVLVVPCLAVCPVGARFGSFSVVLGVVLGHFGLSWGSFWASLGSLGGSFWESWGVLGGLGGG